MKCANPICDKRAVRKYCSSKCSAAVRNRKYYRTLKGRQNKRNAASRYFQAHKQDLYDKRARRMWNYAHGLISKQVETELSLYKPDDPFIVGCIEREAVRDGKRLSRFLYDYHPKDFGDWRGYYRWLLDFDGQMKPFFVRGIHREQVRLKY